MSAVVKGRTEPCGWTGRGGGVLFVARRRAPRLLPKTERDGHEWNVYVASGVET